MNTTRRICTLLMLALLVRVSISALTESHPYDFSALNIDGIRIYYRLINDGAEVEVTAQEERTNDNGWVEMSFGYEKVESLDIPCLVTIPGTTDVRKVTSIGSNAFLYSGKLVSVNLPSTLTQIGNDAFYGCSSLEEIVIPNSVKSIGARAFFECKSLEKITLGSGIIYIGADAFNIYSYRESRLKTVVSLIKDPFEINNTTFPYKRSKINATLYVPTGTRAKYCKTNGWKDFTNIVEKNNEIETEYIVKTSDAGYATFYDSQSAFLLPSGLSAQVVKGISNGRLIYETIADGNNSGIIPKGVPVMLTNAKQQADSFVLVCTESSAIYSGPNLLGGSDDVSQISSGDSNYLFYKLSYGSSASAMSECFGWYWGAPNGKRFLVEGHKAWLAIPKNAATRSYLINDETTGLKEVKSQEDEICFDLMGRHKSSPFKRGFYIMNGKKRTIR